MLVISRKTQERLRIGKDIWVSVERIGPNNVRIGIDCPKHIPIVREELLSEPSGTTKEKCDGE